MPSLLDSVAVVLLLLFFFLYITLWKCCLEVPIGVWIKNSYIKNVNLKMLVWTDFTYCCSGITIVDFEQINAGLVPITQLFSKETWITAGTLCWSYCEKLNKSQLTFTCSTILAGNQMRACNVTEIIVPPWVFFTFFKLYKWYQIDPLIQIENFRSSHQRTYNAKTDDFKRLLRNAPWTYNKYVDFTCSIQLVRWQFYHFHKIELWILSNWMIYFGEKANKRFIQRLYILQLFSLRPHRGWRHFRYPPFPGN